MGVFVMSEVVKAYKTKLELCEPQNCRQSLVRKQDLRRIYKYIFAEGVIVVHKHDKRLSHPEIEGVPNLHVKLTVKSLVSRECLVEHFNWQHHYYVLTNKGLEYLRNYLSLATTCFPDTYQASTVR